MEIVISGAGLAGSLLALFLAEKGYHVTLFEGRKDLRTEQAEAGRSINLALSMRGLTSLSAAGLLNKVQPLLVPMRARAIHQTNGQLDLQSFGRSQDEFINSVNRSQLNALLLDEIESKKNIDVYFSTVLEYVDFTNKQVQVLMHDGTLKTHTFNMLIGSDGANSRLREIAKELGLLTYSRNFLPHGYKELSIDKSYYDKVPKEHLHLWPRNFFMLLGNPNVDKSITATLFMANQGENSFEEIKTPEEVRGFFKLHFSDVEAYMPTLEEEFFKNPIGQLSTIKCSPWYFKDCCLLLGDAAHGIVPFFGQGMNCAFEDCRILSEILESENHHWPSVIERFFLERKKNTDAVAELSMQNYIEIQSNVAEQSFRLKKAIDMEIMRRYRGKYISKHVSVMFSNTPYHEILSKSKVQEALIDSIEENISSIEEIAWDVVENHLNELTY